MNDVQVAKLLAHAINTLGGQDDGDRCCWHECAPCDVLHELIRAGELTSAVRPYVQIGGTWDWWMGTPAHGSIRLSWFLHRMCGATTCQNRHEEK
jgi:hypothetical protein